eukprot:Nk52_evm15s256 gene=Nk52_evmTU15s256
MDKVMKAKDDLEKALKEIPFFVEMEKKTNVPSVYVVGGTGAAVLLSMLYGICANLIVNLVGFIYPAYASFKALETKRKDDDVQWLTYWVVFAAFSIVDYFVGFFLSWTGVYYPFKVVFLLWCYLPQTMGAMLLYEKFIRPFLVKNERKIDNAMKKGMEKFEKVSEEVSELGARAASEVVGEMARKQQ